MHEQAQRHHAGSLIQRCQIQHKDQAAILKEAQQVSQEAGPDGRHDDLLIGEEAREPAFDAGGFGGADAEQVLRHHRQAGLAGKHETEDKEGERFAAMAMHLWQELVDLSRPLAPEVERCFHRESVPFHKALFALHLWEQGTLLSAKTFCPIG